MLKWTIRKKKRQKRKRRIPDDQVVEGQIEAEAYLIYVKFASKRMILRLCSKKSIANNARASISLIFRWIQRISSFDRTIMAKLEVVISTMVPVHRLLLHIDTYFRRRNSRMIQE